MPMIQVIPDTGFIERLRTRTGSVLNTCMQCGACTASCALSADQDVFPRKQMLMSAWGLKDRLMADPYVWICHQCGDCSLTCPRQVKPGEVLTALRQEQIAHYARPRFLARWMQDIRYLPFVLGLPAGMIFLILSLAGTFRIPEGPVNYGAFFPHGWLNVSFTAFFILATSAAFIGLRKYWKSMQAYHPEYLGMRTGGFIRLLLRILRHQDFRQCESGRSRSWSHLFVMWGFILLLFVTFFAILSTLFFEYPLSFFNPVKIAGNLGALLLFTGSSMMVLGRLRSDQPAESRYPDWLFLGSFWLLTLSGILVEAARFLEWRTAYHLYFFHLLMVWLIILYYPYTKFAHFVYRTLGLAFVAGLKQGIDPGTAKA